MPCKSESLNFEKEVSLSYFANNFLSIAEYRGQMRVFWNSSDSSEYSVYLVIDDYARFFLSLEYVYYYFSLEGDLKYIYA